MRDATRMLREAAPDLDVDGEMHADAALSESIRHALNRHSDLEGAANLLVLPNLDAANIAVDLIRAIADVMMVGPILSGTARSAHIVTPSTSAKSIFNMSAIAIADVWRRKNRSEAA